MMSVISITRRDSGACVEFSIICTTDYKGLAVQAPALFGRQFVLADNCHPERSEVEGPQTSYNKRGAAKAAPLCASQALLHLRLWRRRPTRPISRRRPARPAPHPAPLALPLVPFLLAQSL